MHLGLKKKRKEEKETGLWRAVRLRRHSFNKESKSGYFIAKNLFKMLNLVLNIMLEPMRKALVDMSTKKITFFCGFPKVCLIDIVFSLTAR